MRLVGIDQDDVRPLARLQGTNDLIGHDRFGPVDRGHFDRLCGGGIFGVAAVHPMDQQRGPHFAEHVSRVVDWDTVIARQKRDNPKKFSLYYMVRLGKVMLG